MSKSRVVVSLTWERIPEGNANYFLVALFQHADAINIISESREVREDRVGEPYGWDSIELKID